MGTPIWRNRLWGATIFLLAALTQGFCQEQTCGRITLAMFGVVHLFEANTAKLTCIGFASTAATA